MKKPTSRGISVSIGNVEPTTSQTWEEAIWMAGYNYSKRQSEKENKGLTKDKEVQKWFDENIGSLNDHSASSAIHKFRMWLNER